jgi:hypothetical protein
LSTALSAVNYAQGRVELRQPRQAGERHIAHADVADINGIDAPETGGEDVTRRCRPSSTAGHRTSGEEKEAE